MKHTETYQLNLPEGVESRDVAPLNENMRRLDKLLKGLDAAVALTGLSAVGADAGRRLGELEIGSLVKLNENGVPKVYILLEHDHYGCGETTLLRKDTLGPRAFRSCGGGADAESCATNAFAGSEYDTFHDMLHVRTLDPVVRACLVRVPIPCCRGWIGDAFDETVDTLYRRCFPLSRSELGMRKKSWRKLDNPGDYKRIDFPDEGTRFPLFLEEADEYYTSYKAGAAPARVAYYDGTGTAVCWGQRTPMLNNHTKVSYVRENGYSASVSSSVSGGVVEASSVAGYNARKLHPRPALALSPELLVAHEPDEDGCYGVVGLPAFALRAGVAV